MCHIAAQVPGLTGNVCNFGAWTGCKNAGSGAHWTLQHAPLFAWLHVAPCSSADGAVRRRQGTPSYHSSRDDAHRRSPVDQPWRSL